MKKLTKVIVEKFYSSIVDKSNYECNSSRPGEPFEQPEEYIKMRLAEMYKYDDRFIRMINDLYEIDNKDSDLIHKINEINKIFNSLVDYHRKEYISNVYFTITKDTGKLPEQYDGYIFEKRF